MHELSIAWSIIDEAKKIASHNNASILQSIEVDVGQISGIDIDSLKFILRNISRDDNTIKDCIYKFNIINVTKRCSRCNNEYQVSRLSEICNICGCTDSTVISGNELRIASIEI